MRNSAADIFERWRIMDAELARLGPVNEGLNIRKFAKRFGVSERTVQRDLRDFCPRSEREMTFVLIDGLRECYWCYLPGYLPVFTDHALARGKVKPVKR